MANKIVVILGTISGPLGLKSDSGAVPQDRVRIAAVESATCWKADMDTAAKLRIAHRTTECGISNTEIETDGFFYFLGARNLS